MTDPVVFGQADDRTRAQLTRCLKAEPGAVGVLCADNHLGYAMPVGGVVGYRHHVSPNGVGYDMSRRQARGKTKIVRKWRCANYRNCDFAGAAGGFRRGPNNETPRCPKCGHKLRLEPGWRRRRRSVQRLKPCRIVAHA